jgi:hypothetical protein
VQDWALNEEVCGCRRVPRRDPFLVFRCRRRIFRLLGGRLLNFKKGRARGDRQTAHLGRSIFRVTREGKVVEGTATYVVGMKGQKQAKGWLP